ncbi:MAG: leucine-rich repeat domain-containing protein, partial [Bacilli bacterium]|nr:leucine-rich repeat domain-containing protein [Bacilli bacterium]
ATGNDAKFGYIFGTSSYNGGVATNQNGITYYIPTYLETVIITCGTNIPQDAFYNCTDLTNITIPNTVTIIGTNAFNGCVRFTSFTIPNSVTSLGSNILNQCVSLQSITISFVGKSRTSIMHC